MDRMTPKIGVLLIATGRFRAMGGDTAEGFYELRKQREAEEYLEGIAQAGRPVYSGNVYTREDLERQMEQFRQEKVDCVFALFLSWTEDFVWVRFLRDMSPIPILFAARTRERISFGETYAETDFVEFLCAGGLVGSLELFSMTPLLAADRSGFVLASACAGWGGASVLCQTAAVLEGSGLRVKNCVLGKAVQGLLAGALAAVVSLYLF